MENYNYTLQMGEQSYNANIWTGDKCPLRFTNYNAAIIHVDDWIPDYLYNPNGRIKEYIKNVKGAIIIPVSKYYNMAEENQGLDYFLISSKRCYNSDENRTLIAKYLNYFENFYDLDKEYVSLLCQIKLKIELYNNEYTLDHFINDLCRYIYFNKSVQLKVERLVEDNYELNLKYNKSKESLLYTDEHAKILLQISIYMRLVIPLICHYADRHKILNMDQYLMSMYENIFNIFPVDIYAKLYETSYTMIESNKNNNKVVWDMQDIRGKDLITQTNETVRNIILNIMPRYKFSENIIFFNYTSINYNTKFQITDIQYEFSFCPLSSSKRDEDNNSEYDKFEALQIRQDESKYLQNKINYDHSMKVIEGLYGPFDEKEIEFYKSILKKDGQIYINKFINRLVMIPFYKYFGDTTSIKYINIEDYIKIILSCKKLLLNYNMVILPHVLSGYPEKIITRKSMNKKDMEEVEISPEWKALMYRYRDLKVPNMALSDAATIIASKFRFINFADKDIHGTEIPIIPKIIRSEIFTLYQL